MCTCTCAFLSFHVQCVCVGVFPVGNEFQKELLAFFRDLEGIQTLESLNVDGNYYREYDEETFIAMLTNHQSLKSIESNCSECSFLAVPLCSSSLRPSPRPPLL